MPPINLRDYAHTAAQRGWGMGWPSCAGVKASGTAVVTAKRSGTRMSWHVRVARLAATLMDETERRGYLLKPGQCGAYNCRPIAGTSTASNHSWGLAGDINWQSNPFTRPRRTDMPAWLPLLWNRYGFAWGGNYGNDGTTGKADAMHLEFMGTPEQADEMTALALRELTGTATTTTTAEEFLMALSEAEQREILDGIRKMKPGLGLPSRSPNTRAKADDAFGWAINAAAEAADAGAAVRTLANQLAGASGPGQLSDADVQRIAAAVVGLLGHHLAG